MVPEQVYDVRDPLAAKGDAVIPEEQLLKELDINLSQSDNEPDDPSGEKYVANSISYAEQHEAPLQQNSYNAYEAYIFTDQMPQTLSDKEGTETDYIS